MHGRFYDQDLYPVMVIYDESDGPDNLFSSILHKIREHIVSPLCSVFRLSLSSNQMPEDWRNAITASIF